MFFFWTANRLVSLPEQKHMAHYLGVQVMEKQAKTDVAAYLQHHSCCSQGSLGSTTKATHPFWEILEIHKELAEF